MRKLFIGHELPRRLAAVALALAMVIMYMPSLAFAGTTGTVSGSDYVCSETDGWGVDFNKLNWSSGTDDNILGSAANWNALIFGSSKDTVDVEGPVAVQGDFTNVQKGFSIGSGWKSSSIDSTSLLVGGSLSVNGYLSAKGHVAAAGTVSLPGGSDASITKNSDANQYAELQDLYKNSTEVVKQTSSYLARSTAPATTAISLSSSDVSEYFAKAKAAMESLNEDLASRASTVSTSDIVYDASAKNLTLKETSDSLNIFNIKKGMIVTDTNGKTTTLDTIDVKITIDQNGHKDGATNIVNISGFPTIEHSSQAWGESSMSTTTLFNITDAETADFTNGVAIFGSLLAPDTAFTFSSGNVNGNAIIGSSDGLNTGFEFHWHPFKGKIPTTGSITVKKNVEITGNSDEAEAMTKDFYVTLFSDKDCKTKAVTANATKTIHVKDGKADNDVTWSGLEKGKTYYVAETDAQGNVITASDTSSLNVNGYKFETAGSTLGAQTVQVASTGDAAATCTIKNCYKVKDASLKITKKVEGTGNITKTFYVAVFSDKACKNRVGGIYTINIKDGVSGSVSVYDLTAGATYYVAEVDSTGKRATDQSDDLQIDGYNLTAISAAQAVTIPGGSSAASAVHFVSKIGSTSSKIKIADSNDANFFFAVKQASGLCSVWVKGSYDASQIISVLQANDGSLKNYSSSQFEFHTFTTALIGNTAGFDIFTASNGTNLATHAYVTTGTDGALYIQMDQGKFSHIDIGTLGKTEDVIVTNTYEKKPAKASLAIKKLVSGNYSGSASFDFVLTSANAEGEAASPLPADTEVSCTNGETKSFGDITYTSAGTYYYKISEVIPTQKVKGITYSQTPVYAKVVVSESTDGSLQAAVTYGASKDTCTATTVQAVTNYYNWVPANAALQVKKAVSGTYSGSEIFNFNIEAVSGNAAKYLPAVTKASCQNSGTATFGSVAYDETGTYIYKITEQAGSDTHMTYSQTPVYAKVVVTDPNNDGNLVAAVTYGAGSTSITATAVQTVTNTYTNPGSLEVTKAVTGIDDGDIAVADATYKIELYKKSDNTLVGTKNIEVENGVAMNKAEFTDLGPGEYYIVEKNSDGSAVTTSVLGNYSLDSVTITNLGAVTVSAGQKSAATVTNHYTHKLAKLTIEKNVAGAGSVTKTFHVTVFSNAALTERVGSVHTITVTNGTSGSVEVEGLNVGETYYVAETDAQGNVATTSTAELAVSGYNLSTISCSNNGAATIAENNSAKVTVTNTYTKKLGSLEITKNVAGAGNVTKTFHVAVFSNADLTTMVGSVHAITVTNGTSGTVTVSGLQADRTYYVAEVDADGNVATTATTELQITNYNLTTINSSADNGVAVTEGGTAKASVTNTYTHKLAKLTITKNVAGAGDVTKKFYVAVYSDAAKTQRVGNVHEITVTNGTSGSVEVAGLTAGATYYVAETDAQGNIATTSTTDLAVTGYELTAIGYSNSGAATIAENNRSSVTVTNTYREYAKIIVTKAVAKNGTVTDSKMNGTVGIALYDNAEGTGTPVRTGTITITNGTAAGTLTFENLSPGTYYVKETNAVGTYLSQNVRLEAKAYSTDGGAVTVTAGATGNETVTNTYKEITGALAITKEVTGAGNVTKTFHVAVYSDAAMTTRVGDIHDITITNGQSGTVTVNGLTAGQTYYVAEVDANGNVATTATAGLAVSGYNLTAINYSTTGGAAAITENGTAQVKVTNVYDKKLGSLEITKNVAGAGNVTKTFHVAVFSNADLTTMVGSVHAITVTNGTSGTVTVSGLQADRTYYVAEVDENGNIATTETAELAITGYNITAISSSAANGVAVTEGGTAKASVTNTYEEDLASLNITKTVTGAGNVTKTFHVAVFSDAALKTRAGDIHNITITNGTSNTITVNGLQVGKTYYVAEVDANGNAATTSTADLTISGYNLTAINYSTANGASQIAKDNTAAVTITNSYTTPPPPPPGLGSLQVTKNVTLNGADTTLISGTFYMTLFSDADCTQKVAGTTTQAITVLNGVAQNTATWSNLAYGTYYPAETNADGSIVYNVVAPGIDNYTSSGVTGSGNAVSITSSTLVSTSVTNGYTTTTPPENPKDGGDSATTTSTTPQSAATGDIWNGSPWMLLALLGATGLLLAAAMRKRDE